MSRWITALCFYLLGLCPFGTCLTPCAAQRVGNHFARLPSLQSVAKDAVQADGSDSISFAAGAVQLKAPDGWWVQELPRRREVRLVLSPEEFGKRIPRDAIWLCYHVVGPSRMTREAELQGMLPGRLRLSTDATATASAPTVFQFGPWLAVAQEFVSSQSQADDVPIKGRHVLVRTDWGIFELHASAPVNRFETRTAAWTQVWKSIQLEAPANFSPYETTAVLEASAILGSWKSYRSRMRLRHDGTISIVPDSVNLLTTAGSPDVLEGTFESRGDLLFVTWRDGSRLNFRWRSRGSDLFLTDHEGQISQLKRLLE